MALGAQRGSVYRLVLTEAGWLTVVGVAIGLACAVFAASLMRKLLFGTQFWDLQMLGIVAAVLANAAFLASFIPARRAASVDPVKALRAE
jgi:macrolide transport system ATP-binding/permease protein